MTADKLLELVDTYGYAVIGLLAIPEGPLVMMLSGFLVKLGVLAFWPAYVALCIGDLLTDIFWYWAGYKLGATEAARKYAARGVDMERLERVGRAFKKHQTLVLILSKVTCGFGVLAIPIIISAGALGISFRRFFIIYGMGVLVWTLMPMGAGYFFGEWYQSIETWSGRVLFLVTLFGIGIGSFYFLWPMLGALVGKKVIPK